MAPGSSRNEGIRAFPAFDDRAAPALLAGHPLARGMNEGVRPFAGYDDVAQPLTGTSAPLARIETTLHTALSAATTQQPPAAVISCLEDTVQTLSAALAELKQIQNKAG
ncbi:unnamed protein product [Gemmataceae bacterium]|nr:unnamed protein product [Gemmataceae bacterium]VTU00736.1 unnamed protein product [Gemmataceae bacterium]